jgi:hypothetical protein
MQATQTARFYRVTRKRLHGARDKTTYARTSEEVLRAVGFALGDEHLDEVRVQTIPEADYVRGTGR